MSVLSIQSHVCFGHVGNAAAVFPLQRLGFEVWPVNTVQFSNHTGYGAWKGEVFAPALIEACLDGMAERGALEGVEAVLSGYLGSAGTGAVILEAARRVRAASPGALYCCDPVMGDVGRGVFVAPDIPDFIRHQVMPAAEVTTPNQFELELLTGCPIGSVADAVDAAHRLRALGPSVVLVTSLMAADSSPGTIECLAVDGAGAWRVRTPLVPVEPPPNGSGDAIAALFLGHLLKSGSVPEAAARATSALYELFRLTAQAGTRELQLIAAQDAFAAPPRLFAPEPVEG
ncbi:pyridoxal kinase PdxY [Roseospirillum parvum]|uniref:pyridoxal kinase n=1 Tax=Roseospirillum parvum TaxID=83401 RepID=A0A1G7TJ15_9PROT|nr:pyridoxal kinase PdxY [Roseospirillum parvum]SDG35201.1 pyridoxine kinase [Roseospirillum parvum]